MQAAKLAVHVPTLDLLDEIWNRKREAKRKRFGNQFYQGL